MNTSVTASDLLKQVANCRQDQGNLFSYFWEEALAYARSRISPEHLRRVSATEAARDGLREALSTVRRDASNRWSSQEQFRTLFRTIIKRRAADQIRRAGRSGGKSVRDQLADGESTDIGAGTPAELVEAKELSERVAQFVLDEPDPIKQMVNVLGRLAGYSPSSVYRILKGQKSLTTITRWLHELDVRLAQFLQIEVDDES